MGYVGGVVGSCLSVKGSGVEMNTGTYTGNLGTGVLPPQPVSGDMKTLVLTAIEKKIIGGERNWYPWKSIILYLWKGRTGPGMNSIGRIT